MPNKNTYKLYEGALAIAVEILLQRGKAEMKKIETESATLCCGMASCVGRANNSNTKTSRTCVMKHIANSSCQSSIDIICEHAAQGNAQIPTIKTCFKLSLYLCKQFLSMEKLKFSDLSIDRNLYHCMPI
jgi:hypothetical protein